MSAGASVLQRGVVLSILKSSLSDVSDGQLSKKTSMYQVYEPTSRVREKVVFVVRPMFVYGCPAGATQTRYALAFAAAFHLKLIAVCVVDPLGAISVGALLLSQFTAFATVNRACGEKIDGQVFAIAVVVKIASTYHSLFPLGAGSVTVVSVTRLTISAASPLFDSQRRYAVAPVIPVHVNFTGDGTVAPSIGAVSVIDPVGHVGVCAIVKRNVDDC